MAISKWDYVRNLQACLNFINLANHFNLHAVNYVQIYISDWGIIITLSSNYYIFATSVQNG